MHNSPEDRYDKVPYKRCGKSGLKLPIVSLGLWHNFGGVDIHEIARQMVIEAFDYGITHFDLANNYGPPPGSAEETFGKILKDDLGKYRDEMIISTKAGYLMWPGPYGEWGSRKYLLASLDQSLQRMGIDYVDIFYSHRFDPDTPLEETMGALDTAVKSGKALYAGISSYSPEETKEACRILKQMGTPCLIHQPRYNMFDRWIEDGLLDVLKEEGVGCIVFSPLAQGLLTTKYLQGVPEGSRAAKDSGFLQKDQITPEVLERVKKLNWLAQDRGQSLAQMSLMWCVRSPEVTSVLIGASSSYQLKENLEAIKHQSFSSDELNEIDNILNS